MATWVSFSELKARVSMEDILAHYGVLGKLRRHGDELVGLCPFHDDRRPSFSANVSKNVFQCFAGSCQQRGDILDFVANMEIVAMREAALMVKEWFGVTSEPPASLRGASQSPPTRVSAQDIADIETGGNTPLTFELNGLDPKHPYLQERRLTKETIEAFGLGYCAHGRLRGRIAIPIHNEKGELVAYAGRWAALSNQGGPAESPQDQPKYRLPRGFHKSLVVFNLHRAAELAQKRGLILVEGFFAVFWLHQCGFPNVVALMGSSLSQAQEDLLTTVLGSHGRLTLLLDEDGAGRACRDQCLEQLSANVFVKAIRLADEGVQPDQLAEQHVRQLLAD